MTRFAPALFALLLATPAVSDHADDHGHNDAHAHDDHEISHVFDFEGLEVQHPWTVASHEDHATLFMELTNEGDSEISILGAKTEDGASGEVIGFQLQSGNMTEVPIPAMPLAAGASLDMKPDELAIHLEGVAEHREEGHHLEVILMTSKGNFEIDVMIEPEGARQHSHAGHNH